MRFSSYWAGFMPSDFAEKDKKWRASRPPLRPPPELVNAMEAKVEDIKKEFDTQDEEVKNSSEVPLVVVKVEALEGMKIENGEKDNVMENLVEVYLVEPKTEVKEESDDAPDPMVETHTEQPFCSLTC